MADTNSPSGYKRQETSPFSQYGITCGLVSILDIKYDAATQSQIDAQKQANLAVITSKTKSLEAIQRTVQITEEGRAAAERAKWEQEKGWVIPIIPFSKKEFYGLRYAMYMRMQHNKRVLLPNTEELERCKANIRTQQEALANTENPDSYWYGKLFPMVKRYDYEKALRIYEQEQKEADLERQE